MVDKKLLRAFRREKNSSPPFWFMRQAGRYLPEYRALRATTKGFLDFCYDAKKASEATLQPIKRFGMDGAIIFSDILVVPHALGANVRFEEGHGPLLEPVDDEKKFSVLHTGNFANHLAPVYEALRLTRAALPKETTLIGFCGAPWTLACYLVEGKGSRDFQKVRITASRDKIFFTKLIDLLTDAVTNHAIAQIEAGAEVIQIFDSWAGVLSEPEFMQWGIAPVKKIVAGIRERFPEIPIIGFPRMAGQKIAGYISQTGVNAVSIDGSVTLAWAAKEIQPHCVVQGNLDPIALAEDSHAMLAQAKAICEAFGDNAFIFNLGHGILPHTPIEHVETLCNFLRKN